MPKYYLTRSMKAWKSALGVGWVLGSLVLIHPLLMLMSMRILLQCHSLPSRVFGGGTQIEGVAESEEEEMEILLL